MSQDDEQRLRTLRSLVQARTSVEDALRDELVAARRANVSLARIADAVDLSPSRVHEIVAERISLSRNGQRMTRAADTVIIPARRAYDLYLAHAIYRCQDGRSFREVEYLGFYKDKAIQPHIARILLRRDHVLLTPENAAELRRSGDSDDLQLADAIETIIAVDGYLERDVKQVFLLSAADDSRTIHLRHPIPHLSTGRGSAFTQNQRYTSSEALQGHPASTHDL